jgi:hypothetical protein
MLIAVRLWSGRLRGRNLAPAPEPRAERGAKVAARAFARERTFDACNYTLAE